MAEAARPYNARNAPLEPRNYARLALRHASMAAAALATPAAMAG